MTGAAPSGVVTFLFTDVEGSTRRWETDADAMRSALTAHDNVLRNAIETHGGFMFKHTGDGVCAAFARRVTEYTAGPRGVSAAVAEAGLGGPPAPHQGRGGGRSGIGGRVCDPLPAVVSTSSPNKSRALAERTERTFLRAVRANPRRKKEIRITDTS
jgi:class 3 adenylate cyclase